MHAMALGKDAMKGNVRLQGRVAFVHASPREVARGCSTSVHARPQYLNAAHTRSQCLASVHARLQQVDEREVEVPCRRSREVTVPRQHHARSQCLAPAHVRLQFLASVRVRQ
jgi:hypothetical protein